MSKIEVLTGKCSLCHTDGTNKSTCPLNKEISIDKINFSKHRLAKTYMKHDDAVLKYFKTSPLNRLSVLSSSSSPKETKVKTSFGLIKRGNVLPPLAMVMDSKLNTAEDILSMIEINRLPIPKDSASPTWVGFGKYIGSCTPMPCPTLDVVIKISSQWNIDTVNFTETVEFIETKYNGTMGEKIPNDIAVIIAKIVESNRKLINESLTYKKIYDSLSANPYYDQYVNNLPYVSHENYTTDNWSKDIDKNPLKKFLHDVHKQTMTATLEALYGNVKFSEILKWLLVFAPDTLHILITERNIGKNNVHLSAGPEAFMQSHLFQCFVTLKLLHEYNIYHTDLHVGNAFIADYSAENDKDPGNPYFEYFVNDSHYLIEKQYGIFRLFDWDRMSSTPVQDTTGAHPDYLQYLNMSGGIQTSLKKYMPMGLFMLDKLKIANMPKSVEAEYPRYVTIDELLEDRYFDNIRTKQIKRKSRPILTHLDFMLTLYDIPLPEATELSFIIEYTCDCILKLSPHDAKTLLFALILFDTQNHKEIPLILTERVLAIYRSLKPENILIAETVVQNRTRIPENRSYFSRWAMG